MKIFQPIKFKIDNPYVYMTQLRARIIASICAGFCIVAFAFSFFSALQLKMHSEIPFWVWHAVSPAFSKVAFDTPRYMTLNAVYDKFIDFYFYGDFSDYYINFGFSFFGGAALSSINAENREFCLNVFDIIDVCFLLKLYV